MKTTKYLWIAPLAGVLNFTGCSTAPTSSSPPTASAAPTAAPMATGRAAGLVSLTKNTPNLVAVGEQFSYELIATAQADVSDVTIVDTVPAGATYVGSQPEAATDRSKLTWKFDSMAPGETKTMRVTLKADKEGQLTHCATASALPQVCLTTTVGRPQLALRATGPAVAQLGQDVVYTVMVGNSGNTVAKGVVVTDTLPEGLSSPNGGKELTFQAGDVAPAGSKSITVLVKAAKRGPTTNTFVAASSNAGKASAEVPTTIVQSSVKIQNTTKDKDIYINRAAAYNIVVSNTGDTRLTGLVVTDKAAPETIIATAEGATVTGTTAVWNIPELKPGETKSFTVKVVSKVPGTFTDTANVLTAEGHRDSAQDSTTWKGITGVALEITDDPDPIQIGETSKYTVRISNQGSTVPISQLSIIATLPEQLEIVPGTVSDGGVVEGRKISWPAIATVPPKGSVLRTYIAKGVKAGDGRTSVAITTSMRKDPIEERESTTVY